MENVYRHYDFLKRLADKRFSDSVMADEAFSYAFEKLAEDDWRRVRAYEGKSSFQRYLGCVWVRLLDDYSIKKYGRITPPTWIRKLGGVWEELFRLLCIKRLPFNQAIEQILRQGVYNFDSDDIERTAEEILAAIPQCGRKVGPSGSTDDALQKVPVADESKIPESLSMGKEKWMALQAISRVFFKYSDDTIPDDEAETKILVTLVGEIRNRISLKDEEQLMLTAHFVDGQPISTVGRCLGLNQNQVHGKFRRLMTKINKSLTGVLDSYL